MMRNTSCLRERERDREREREREQERERESMKTENRFTINQKQLTHHVINLKQEDFIGFAMEVASAWIKYADSKPIFLDN